MCQAAPLAIIRQKRRQVSRGSAVDYQADEQAGVTRLNCRLSTDEQAGVAQLNGDYEAEEQAGDSWLKYRLPNR